MKKATSYLIAILAVASMFAMFAQREAKAGEVFQALRGDGDMVVSGPDGLVRTCKLYGESGVLWGTASQDFSGVNFQNGSGSVVVTITRIVGNHEVGQFEVEFPFVSDPSPAAIGALVAPYMLTASEGTPKNATGALSGVTRCVDRCLFEVDEMGLPVKCIDCLHALFLN